MKLNPKFEDRQNRHFKTTALSGKVMLVIDRKLRECVCSVTGVWPDDDMIEAHGCRLVQPNGDWTFTWDNQKIMRVDFYSDRVDIYPCNANGSPKVPEGSEHVE